MSHAPLGAGVYCLCCVCVWSVCARHTHRTYHTVPGPTHSAQRGEAERARGCARRVVLTGLWDWRHATEKTETVFDALFVFDVYMPHTMYAHTIVDTR